MADVAWLTESVERTWRALQLMQMRLEGELARQLVADSGLSCPDYVVLVALADRPDGRMRVFELAAILGWEKSRLSHHVARMIRTSAASAKTSRKRWDAASVPRPAATAGGTAPTSQPTT